MVDNLCQDTVEEKVQFFGSDEFITKLIGLEVMEE